MKNHLHARQGFSKIGVIAVVAIVALIGVATFFVVDGNNKATNFDNYDFYSIIEPDDHNGNIGDHVKGSANAPVIVFEYADFQCPGCASLNPRVNQAVTELDGKLGIVYRNHLLSYHQNSTAAASAAEAAGLQGYWKEYADALFANQTEWEYASGSERTSLFDKYFADVTGGRGDIDKFHQDIASNGVSKKISFDMGIGKRIEIPGTPAFFVDGQYIDWSNKDGGSVTINGKAVTWDHNLSGNEFVQLLKDIVAAKTAA
ncbi:thioredoxin domain-containing protein [Candidatus Saccharibacteria bacterium]|nr:thioredoxin domain-containing protein [Candidatus Saccharibacteria bacterium]